jgi:hypothetical protein
MYVADKAHPLQTSVIDGQTTLIPTTTLYTITLKMITKLIIKNQVGSLTIVSGVAMMFFCLVSSIP